MAAVRDAAAYLIAKEKKITNLRLNELLYYGQGMSLAMTGKALFDEEIAAWDCGPVVESVYRCYHEQFEGAPIIPQEGICYHLTSVEREILQQVLERFGRYTGFELVSLVQKPDAPWRKARERGASVISQKEMQAYFKEKLSV